MFVLRRESYFNESTTLHFYSLNNLRECKVKKIQLLGTKISDCKLPLVEQSSSKTAKLVL